MCVFRKGGVSVYGVVSAFLTLVLLFAVISFFSSEFEEGGVSEEESLLNEEKSVVSLSGSLENSFFENDKLVLRDGGGAELDLELGSYKVFVDLQECSNPVVNRSQGGVSYNSLKERVVFENGEWVVKHLSSEEKKQALLDERVHTLFVRDSGAWESYHLPLSESMILNSSGVVSFSYMSRCSDSLLVVEVWEE